MLTPLLSRRALLQRLGYALGGIATAPLASGLLAGCATPDGPALADYTFQTLDDGQQRLVAALVDQILPATDTPGASDVGVPQFIDTMLAEWYAPDERDGFLAGLAAVETRANGFEALDADARLALVTALDAEAYGAADPPAVDDDVAEAAQEGTYAAQAQAEREVAGMQGELGEAQDDAPAREVDELGNEVDAPESAAGDGPPFFRQLKELTLAGYYTSEAGATEELQWLAAPGRYDADVPVSEVGRAWA